MCGTVPTAAPSSYQAPTLRIEAPYMELHKSVGINFGNAKLFIERGTDAPLPVSGHVTTGDFRAALRTSLDVNMCTLTLWSSS